MYELFMGLTVGFLTVLLRELQHRSKRKYDSINPPPPGVDICKKCFFFNEFRRKSPKLTINIGDTQLIHRYRFIDDKKEENYE